MNKYIIGEKVFVYDRGKLVERTITEIQIIITQSKTQAGYQFKEDTGFMHRFYKNESEVFESVEHFINLTTGTLQKDICPLRIEPDYTRPFQATIKFLPKFRVQLNGAELKEGKLNDLIKVELPAINDNETLNLHCLSYSVLKSHIVPEEIPASSIISS